MTATSSRQDLRLGDSADVIVVGGGPVGVMTALLLAQRGLSVQLFERDTEIYDLPRAISMDDEIQRVFQNAGLENALLDLTTPTEGAEFVRAGGERIVGVALPQGADWPLGHHPTVNFYQPTLEEMLRTAASDAGVVVCLGHVVGEVSQHSSGVRAMVAADGVERSVEARWLVAADGAASPIRKQLGIEFIDQGFDQGWLVIDVELLRPVPSLPTWVQQICDPARPTTFVMGHNDYRRWELQLLDHEDPKAMSAPERVWELLAPWLGPEDARLVRAVVYRFHATVAARMRQGRILLAGDAAHQMPPFLGQGMCSGIRDAANVAWKLALVDSGQASEALLDTYDEERRPHAAATVAHAVDTGKLIDELSAASGSPDLSAAYGGGRAAPRIEHGLVVGAHRFVGRQLPQPELDGRRLDDVLGAGYALVVRAGVHPRLRPEDRRAVESFGRVVEIPSPLLDPLLPDAGAIVVRPDRYIAAIVDDVTELATALEAVLPPAPEPSTTS